MPYVEMIRLIHGIEAISPNERKERTTVPSMKHFFIASILLFVLFLLFNYNYFNLILIE